MKSLLTVSAFFEGLVGISLMIMPAVVTPLLLGYTIQDPAVKIICGITGAALVTLSVGCWSSRNSLPQAAMMCKAMFFYNVAASLVLLYAALGLELSGIGLWPAIIAHAGLAVWCTRTFSA